MKKACRLTGFNFIYRTCFNPTGFMNLCLYCVLDAMNKQY